MKLASTVFLRTLSPYFVGASSLAAVGYNVYSHQLRFKFLRYFKWILNRLKIYFTFLIPVFWRIPLIDIKKADKIIAFDSNVDYYLCKIISHCYPQKHLIIYLWNSIEPDVLKIIESVKNTNWQIWSFDDNNCIHYHLKYNKTFMASWYLRSSVMPNVVSYDVFFIGSDKGERISQIEEIKKIFISNKITYNILISSFNKKIYKTKSAIYSPPLKYIEVLNEIQKVKAILDIVKPGQSGITQREMEALCFNKKLITNNKHVKKRDYYYPENIYILDFDNPCRDLKEFLDTPTIIVSEEIKQGYHIEVWLKRFTVISQHE
jgi:hypothetical protein